MNDDEFAGLPVIAAARRGYSPTREIEERVKLGALMAAAKLDAFERASSGSVGSDAGGEFAPNVATAGGINVAPWLLKGILASCFTIVGFGAGYWARGREIAAERPHDEVARVIPPPAAAASAEPSLPLPPSAEGPTTADTKEPIPTPPPRGPVQRLRPSVSLEEEAALLGRVEQALRADDPAAAEAALRRLDQRVPRGKLGEEREALAIIALCQAERPEGASRAASFTVNHPSSVYLKRVELACVKK